MAYVDIQSVDTLPIINTTRSDAFGPAIDLSGATVKFGMKQVQRETAISSNASIANAADDQVSYAWATTGTQETGIDMVESRCLQDH